MKKSLTKEDEEDKMQKLEITTEYILSITGGELIGSPSRVYGGLNRIENADESEISFISGDKFADYLSSSHAGLIITKREYSDRISSDKSYILTDNPYEAFLKLIFALDSKRYNHPDKLSGISKNAFIKRSAVVAEDAYIGDGVFLDDNVVINSGAKIYSNVSIASNSVIGEGTIIYSGAIIAYESKIGKNCIIHSNAVIGSDGFGFVEHEDGSYTKIPQIGNVVIGDNCEIGACTTIDRALVGSTIIEDGVKIDNLVQIAHNVEIGENSAFAAQAGIAGSTKLGKRVRMGGQAGTAGHISIADDVTVLAKGGVAQSIDKKGTYFGAPAKPKRDAFRVEAVLPQLPEMYKELKRLRDEVDRLKGKG
jgi:UDP-3-O-[3-hydroxymyristoyl] glucosamine N-acyltransferase